MSEDVFYKKIGNDFVPVYYYDSEVMDAISEGSHLIVKRKGSDMRLYNVEPALAPMIAAGLYAKDKMTAALLKASELRMPASKQPLTAAQVQAWNALAASFGKEMYQLEWPSYAEIAEAGITAMQEEAEKLLEHPSVRTAYDQFLLMCELARKDSNE